MKAEKFILLLLVITFFCTNSYSKIIDIWHPNTVNLFLPTTVEANVGDTIRWRAGEFEIHHTSVCDGRPRTLLPSGAAPWVSPILTMDGFYYGLTVPGTYVYICAGHLNSGTINVSVPTVINSNLSDKYTFNLYQNYPNPFNPSTAISYSLIEYVFVSLKIYDVLGNEVATLVNEYQNLGNHNYQLSTVNYQLSSGIYFYKLTAGSYSETKQMILLK